MIPQSLGTMWAHIGVNTSALSAGIAAAQVKLKAFQSSVQSMGMSSLMIGGALAAPLVAATKIFAAFDDQMRLTAAVSGSTGQAFEELTEKAKFLGRTTSFTARQVAGGMVELGRAGFSSTEMKNSIGDVLNLARATGTDLSEATTIAGGTLRSFSLDAREMVRVADVMTATANASAQTLSDLGKAMEYAAPTAATLKMTMEETAKAIGTMANFSIRGSMAGTSLRMILLRLAESGTRAKVEKMIGSIQDKDGKMVEVSEILKRLYKSMKGMSDLDVTGVMSDLFGARAVGGGMKLATGNFEKLNDAIANAEGTAKRTAAAMDAGLGGTLRILWSAVEGAAIAVGEGLAPALDRMSKSMTKSLGPITQWVEKNAEMIVGVGKIALGFLAFGAAALVISMVTKTVLVLIGAVKAAIVVIHLLKVASIAMTATPMGLAMLAFAAAVGIAIYAVKKFGKEYSKLITTQKDLISVGQSQRKEDTSRMQRLEQLADKESLNNTEMKEAENLIGVLNNRYGDLGITLDKTAGKIGGVTAASAKLREGMKQVAKNQIDMAIREHERNAEALEKDMRNLQDTWWTTEGDQQKMEDMIARDAAERNAIRNLKLQRGLLDAGGSTTGGDGIDLNARIALSKKEAEEVAKWSKNIEAIKIAAITNETQRQLAEIHFRYKNELQAAENNAEAKKKIEIAKDLEIGNTIAAAQAALAEKRELKGESEAQAVLDAEQKLAQLRNSLLDKEIDRRLAAIDTEYAYAIKEAKNNMALVRKLEEMHAVEREKALKDAAEKDAKEKSKSEVKDAKKDQLPTAVEKGTAEAYSAIVGQDKIINKKIAKNTGDAVKEQKETNKKLDDMLESTVPVLVMA